MTKGGEQMTKGAGIAVVTRKADARSYETRALTLEPWISRPGSGIQDRDAGSSPQVNAPPEKPSPTILSYLGKTDAVLLPR